MHHLLLSFFLMCRNTLIYILYTSVDMLNKSFFKKKQTKETNLLLRKLINFNFLSWKRLGKFDSFLNVNCQVFSSMKSDNIQCIYAASQLLVIKIEWKGTYFCFCNISFTRPDFWRCNFQWYCLVHVVYLSNTRSYTLCFKIITAKVLWVFLSSSIDISP